MEVREYVGSLQAKAMSTSELRSNFLVSGLFSTDNANLVYSHVDRMIIGGIMPVSAAVGLPVGKELGTSCFLERREMGIINIGGAGSVTVDGTVYSMGPRDGLYIGMGAVEVLFSSASADAPAKFYFNSAPAHRSCKTRLVTLAESRKVALGSAAEANKRVINQYIHPAVLESCQLVMGMTMFEPGSMWNTMPTHTHERRMEAYFYFDMPSDRVVLHLMGKPDETRHLVVRNEEAVISPSWSIHAGVGTGSYTFIWGMAGENQTFDDMDFVPMDALR